MAVENSRCPLRRLPRRMRITSAHAPPPKAPQPIDISYIPPDAAFALVVDPYQITRSPNLAVLNDSNMKETLLVDWGIDLDATEQVILIGGLGKKLGSFFTGTILHYKQPFDLPKYLQWRAPSGKRSSPVIKSTTVLTIRKFPASWRPAIACWSWPTRRL